jgi:hypothetical protein
MLATLTSAAFLAGGFGHPPAQAAGKLQDLAPEGWGKAGANRVQYDVGVDRRVKHAGTASAYVKPNVLEFNKESFGTLMQSFRADEYRGKRVRMTAYVKAEDVGRWAGLWMRIDGATKSPMTFDNMGNRPIKGTSDWQKYELVLDIPDDSAAIAFGILLAGGGQVWVDDFNFEVVGNDVPSTDRGVPVRDSTESEIESRRGYLEKASRQPSNLDFEKE